jgi:diguanylate cyclase (GGDEF)-like protein
MRALVRLLCGLVLTFGVLAARAAADAPGLVTILDRASALVPGPGCDVARIATLPVRCFVAAASLGPAGTATLWRPMTRWYRFSAPETATGAAWQLVVSTYVTAGDLAIFTPDGRKLDDLHFGSTIPVADRPVRSHDIRVPLPAGLPAGTRFAVGLTSPYSLPDVLQLQTAASLAAQDRATLEDGGLPFAFLNGGALTMALFNIVLYVMLRRWIYLTYAGAIAMLVFYQVVETGTAWTLLWPHLGLRDDYPSYVVWVAYVALIVLFTRRMLYLPKVAPLVDRALLVVFAVVVADSAAYVLVPDLLQKAGVFTWLDPVVTALMLGTMLTAGVVAVRGGVSGAIAYTIAFAGSAVGIVVADVGFFDPAFASDPAMAYLPASYGVLWESVFLAAALGQRVRDAERNAAQLSEYAFRDGLTGIANRRSFDEAVAREWSRVQRTGGTVAVAIFDIDHFKAYNDRFGHPAGDQRLIAVARIVAEAARREGDLGARYGGEEFALLLPNTTAEAAYAIAEGVRERVAASAGEGGLTISAGVAEAIATPEFEGAHDLLVAADTALYAAKAGGRNRTVRADSFLGGTAARVGGG